MTIVDALRLYLVGGEDTSICGTSDKQDEGIAALREIVGESVFWPEIPRGSRGPCIVFSRASASRLMTADGPSGLANPRYQFTCVGTTQTQAEEIGDALRRAMDGFLGTISTGEELNIKTIRVHGIFLQDDADEPVTRADLETADLPAMRLDFTVWHNE